MISNHCKNKLLWGGVRAELCCKSKYKHLEGSWILYKFNQIAVVSSPLRSITSPAPCSWWTLQYQSCVSSSWVSLKFNQAPIGYLQDISHVLAYPEGPVDTVNCRIYSQVWFVHNIYPLAACIAPNTMYNGHQGQRLQVSTSLNSASPVTEMCGVFSNMVLPLSSGRQIRTIATGGLSGPHPRLTTWREVFRVPFHSVCV